MRAGSLRHSVSIENYTTARGANGTETQSWSAAETVWASIEQLSGRELMIARQIKADATHRITMRYTSNLTAKSRVVFGSRVFYPLDPPANTDQKNFEYVFMARESPSGV